MWPAALLSEGFSRVTGRPVIFNRDKVRELRFTHWTCSSAKAAEELGFAPAYDLCRGVLETAAWYRSEGWLGLRTVE
jgi:nucleoside-diphosphate-sugar epimerase